MLRLKGFFRLFDSTHPGMDDARTTQEPLSRITHTVRANVRLMFKTGRRVYPRHQ